MALPDDLLRIAREMVDRNPGGPIEAELRRAISTAYYALFHLLVQNGTERLVATPRLRTHVARTFEHKHMKSVCQEFAALKRDANGEFRYDKVKVVPAQLIAIASAFIDLHEARHTADYDTSTVIDHARAAGIVLQAEQAFANWVAVQADPIVEPFLAELWCRGIPKR